jgi:hypothetical protein
MAEAAGNYSSIEIRERLHSQAFRVWAIALAIVVLWLLVIVSPPILISIGVYASPV